MKFWSFSGRAEPVDRVIRSAIVLVGLAALVLSVFASSPVLADATQQAAESAAVDSAGLTPQVGSVDVQVSAGHDHTCGVHGDGTVSCWGSNQDRRAIPPSGAFKSLAVGGRHTCAIRSDDTMACWGYNLYGQSTPMSGTFKSVSAGTSHTCGVRTDDTLSCRGQNPDGRATPPSGTFKNVSAGLDYTCGVRTDGTVACWGNSSEGRTTPPAGTFESTAAGQSSVCGVRTDKTVACWGNTYGDQTMPPAGTFLRVSAGANFNCGVRTDSTIACWGAKTTGLLAPPSGTFASVSAGFDFACAVRTDQTVTCWGNNVRGQTMPPSPAFESMSTANDYTCALAAEGTVTCWGDNRDGKATPPADLFSSISSGGGFSCGIREDATLACWGTNGSGQLTPPSGTFTSVSVGLSHACAVRTEGTVACWGYEWTGETIPPPGNFTSVSAGSSYTCGVRDDGTVACWGNDDKGQATPPSGEFTSVSAGVSFSCGVRVDGTAACWGWNGGDVSTPPAGTFTSVSPSDTHTCGVRTDGSLACWGAEGFGDYGKLEAPVGSFTSVGARGAHTCARRADSVFQCWGDVAALGDPFGPASAPSAPAKPTAAAGNASVTITWTAPPSGGSPITGYTVRAVEDTSKKCTTTGALTCTVTGLTNGTAYTFQVRATNAVGNSTWSPASDAVTPTDTPLDGSTYFHPISPTRLIDPRPAWKVGPFSTPWNQAQEREVQVTGEMDIPADAKAVVLNVTVTDVTAPGGTFISVYPKGGTRPNVSSLNASYGQTIANSVTTKIGDGGKITIYNEAGKANVIVDVAGYYTQGSGDGYTAMAPTRVIDSRPSWQHGPFSTPWNAAQSRDVTIDTSNTAVPTGADAVVLNVTATDVTQPTFISVYPKGTAVPTASNLNLAAGNTIANQVVVKLGTANQISVYNEAGKANVIVDVVGYYASGSGDAFYPVAPQRIIDPRPAWKVGPFSSPWGNKTTREVQVTTNADVPTTATAVVMNVTATDVTQGTFVTVFPGGTVPTASNLNAATGWTIANAVTAKLSASGKISVYNEKPSANVIVDVNGYFG